MCTHKAFRGLAIVGFMMLLASAASAQTSNIQAITINAQVPSVISIDVPSATTVNFVITDLTATTAGNVTPTFGTSWNLKSGQTLSVCAYISGALTGTAGNIDTIAPSFIQVNGGSGFVSFGSGSACGQAGGVVLSSTAITGLNHHSNRSDTLQLQLLPVTVQPDTYTGTLNVVAQAI